MLPLGLAQEEPTMTIPSGAAHATIGANVHIEARNISVGEGVILGDEVRIECDRLVLRDGARLDAGVTVRARHFELGHSSRIETRCVLGSMSGTPSESIRFGDCSLLSHDSKLLVPAAAIGDYTAIHNHALINGRKPLAIGHNCWIGQHCVLNSEDTLTVGNHVGIGASSSVYTHGYFGDLLEGSQVFKVAPVTIEDDTWILGAYNIVSPGVVLGEKSLVLTGSNVTRSVPPNHCVGGAPAKDMTDRITPYRSVPLEEKQAMVRGYVREFLEESCPRAYREEVDAFVVPEGPLAGKISFIDLLDQSTPLPHERPLIVIAGSVSRGETPSSVTWIDLERRCYRKTRSSVEVRLLGFLKSYRARFVPEDRPRVELPALSEGDFSPG